MVRTSVKGRNPRAQHDIGDGGSPGPFFRCIVLLKGISQKDSRSSPITTAAKDANSRRILMLHWFFSGGNLNVRFASPDPLRKSVAPNPKAYFDSRPQKAAVSPPGFPARATPWLNRSVLEKKLAALEAKYPGVQVPLPPYWGGFRLAPLRIEFWQGRPNRLHDRFQIAWKQSRGLAAGTRLSP